MRVHWSTQREESIDSVARKAGRCSYELIDLFTSGDQRVIAIYFIIYDIIVVPNLPMTD